MQPEFVGFSKIHRLSREIIVTEKIDGTNAQVFITDDGEVFAGSRTRWITPGKEDNAGFAAFVRYHQGALVQTLGPGQHFGEWWGRGIQRGYGLDEKRFSLFNTTRWAAETLPPFLHVVPVLYQGIFNLPAIEGAISHLAVAGSKAAPGFMKPEGVVIYHVQGNVLFKKTLEKDEQPKGIANA